jgi:uncharacterized membrane protein YphA (DoxX/SURF4 family)
LLLRVSLGVVVLYQGGVDLFAGTPVTLGTWSVELVFGACAILLIAGLYTPCAAAVLSALVFVAHYVLSPAGGGLSVSAVSTALVAATAAAIVLLGPGALSVDARMFGLREIIIPTTHSKRPPKQER